MPAISPSAMINAIMEGFHQSGASAFFLSQSIQTQPREFLVEHSGNTFSVWIYIWTLTHGGRSTLPDEYRIQMTSVSSPLPLNPNGYTVLMGYYPNLNMFAGFDISKHREFTVGSPSVQVDIGALHQALQLGFSFHRKNNEEIAVGIRPDNLVNYISAAESLHVLGAEVEIQELLNQAADPSVEIAPSIADLSTDRQKVVSEVSRYSRDTNFRKSVVLAYDNRCAVLRSQLKLVDAAHILPVRAEGSSDHVSNGLCLSPTLHRAYDNCLIYLDSDCCIRLNEAVAERLISDNLHAGLDALKGSLDTTIHLPLDNSQRPNPEFIERANSFRRIPGYC